MEGVRGSGGGVVLVTVGVVWGRCDGCVMVVVVVWGRCDGCVMVAVVVVVVVTRNKSV